MWTHHFSDYACHLQVSVGGRDNFLAAESDKTIALMIDCCSESKVATALLAHVQHKSPQVRAKIASHLDSLVQGDHGMRLAGEISIIQNIDSINKKGVQKLLNQ